MGQTKVYCVGWQIHEETATYGPRPSFECSHTQHRFLERSMNGYIHTYMYNVSYTLLGTTRYHIPYRQQVRISSSRPFRFLLKPSAYFFEKFSIFTIIVIRAVRHAHYTHSMYNCILNRKLVPIIPSEHAR